MDKATRFFGLDVHKATIAVAVAEPSGEVRSLGTIPNDAEAIARLVRKQGDRESLSFCYEAGPTGYVLYWQLVKLGVNCVVVAPTLVPVKAGDRVKTDRRDAEKLARCYRAGDLTPIWIPTAAHEALRDLVRARESAKKDRRATPATTSTSRASPPRAPRPPRSIAHRPPRPKSSQLRRAYERPNHYEVAAAHDPILHRFVHACRQSWRQIGWTRLQIRYARRSIRDVRRTVAPLRRLSCAWSAPVSRPAAATRKTRGAIAIG
jgi:hypothetical protein